MKRILMLALGVLSVFGGISCKKETSIANLNGTWELRTVVGGQVPSTSPNLAPGNGNLMKFDQQHYEQIVDGKIVENDTYTLTPEKAKVNNQEANFNMATTNHGHRYIKLSARSLVIFVGVIAADGFELHYIKI